MLVIQWKRERGGREGKKNGRRWKEKIKKRVKKGKTIPQVMGLNRGKREEGGTLGGSRRKKKKCGAKALAGIKGKKRASPDTKKTASLEVRRERRVL